MADKRITDFIEAASAGADYYLVTDSASDGVKKIKPANIVPAFTGDVTKAAGGTVTTIAANAVTNSKAAQMAAGTIKSNLTGALASASDNTINAVMDAAFGSVQGAVAYRDASGWTSLPPGVSGQFFQTSGPAANPIWQTIPGGGNMLSSTYDPTGQLSDAFSYSVPGTGAVSRLIKDRLGDVISVRDFGAVCDGVADDTAAIQAALNTGRLVILPDNRTCKITSSLQITIDGTGLVGAGWKSSALTSSATGAGVPMITIAAGVNNVYLSSFKLTRSVTAATNSDGIFFAGNTEGTLLKDIWVEKQFNGYTFRTTSYGVMENLVSSLNLNHGYVFSDTATVGVLQWEIRGAIAGQNAGVGFQVATGNGTLPATMGTWIGVYTFANSSIGVAFLGTPTAPIYDVRVMGSFFGSDGNSLLFLDTHGGSILIGDCFFELAGRGLTGPTNTTPASNIGSGIEASANNRDVRISNCISDGNSQAGYKLAATQENNLSGSRGSNNGTFGVLLADGTTGILTGNKFIGNTSGPFSITSNGASIVASGNSPAINPSLSAVLSADVALSNTANYFDGPSVTLGAGTWFVSGTVTVADTVGAAGIFAKLWDGTTVIASARQNLPAGNTPQAIALSGVIAATNGTVVKISCLDANSTSGLILANNTGNAKDSSIMAVRIG